MSTTAKKTQIFKLLVRPSNVLKGLFVLSLTFLTSAIAGAEAQRPAENVNVRQSLDMAKNPWMAPYRTLLLQILKVYVPEFQSQNETLKIEVVSGAPMYAIGPVIVDQERWIKMTDEVLKTYNLKNPLDREAFRLTLCHEIGHLTGSAPRRQNPESWETQKEQDGSSFYSSEAQSDYFAALKCYRRVMKSLSSSQFESEMKNWPVSREDQKIKSACKDSHENALDQKVCYRSIRGAWRLVHLLQKLDEKKKARGSWGGQHLPEKATLKFWQKEEAVEKTITESYPSLQCRWESFREASLCAVSETIAVDRWNSQTGSCLQPEKGSRPSCWYLEK